MDPDVPLLIPEVNAAHLEAIPLQQKLRGYHSGFIVTNPNCSTAGLVLVLKPLADAFGLEKIFVVTLQAVSGAGYPGVASMDIHGNVVPVHQRRRRKDGIRAAKAARQVGRQTFRRCRPRSQRPLQSRASPRRPPRMRQHQPEENCSQPTKCAKRSAVLKSARNSHRCRQLCAIPFEVLDDENRPQPRRDVNAGQRYGRRRGSRPRMPAPRHQADAALAQLWFEAPQAQPCSTPNC